VPLSSFVSDGIFSLDPSSYQGLALDSEIKLLQVSYTSSSLLVTDPALPSLAVLVICAVLSLM
jgi:hypothetical protein